MPAVGVAAAGSGCRVLPMSPATGYGRAGDERRGAGP